MQPLRRGSVAAQVRAAAGTASTLAPPPRMRLPAAAEEQQRQAKARRQARLVAVRQRPSLFPLRTPSVEELVSGTGVIIVAPSGWEVGTARVRSAEPTAALPEGSHRRREPVLGDGNVWLTALQLQPTPEAAAVDVSDPLHPRRWSLAEYSKGEDVVLPLSLLRVEAQVGAWPWQITQRLIMRSMGRQLKGSFLNGNTALPMLPSNIH